MRIPIKSLKEFSKDYGLSHVIVFAFDGKLYHIATYGKTIENCSQAADFGNKLKKGMGWPKSLMSQPSRVKSLQREVESLKKQIELLSSGAPKPPQATTPK